MNAPEPLTDLVDAEMAGRATPAQSAALAERIREDDEAARAYMRAVFLHAQLRQVMSTAHARDSKDAAAPPVGRLRVGVTAGALAACLLCAAVVGWALYARTGGLESGVPSEPPAVTVATVIEATGPLVVNDNLVAAGEEIDAGTVALGGGSAEFRLTSGVSVRLNGPTDLIVEDPMTATLSRGAARFHCPPEAHGMVVRLPGDVRVIDLGTEFGVTVDEHDAAEVTVDEGRVMVDDRGAVRPILWRGDTAAVADGQIVGVTRGPMIARITANSGSPYRLADLPLAEDAPSHADRAYQWNGVTADGLPPALIGAEYVRTAMVDKLDANLRVDLALSRPGTLYVWLDERDTPGWVSEAGFVATDMRVGLDNVNPGNPGVGPGRDIGAVFVVHVLRIDNPTTVTLGPAQAGANGKIGTYGIAAVPDPAALTDPPAVPEPARPPLERTENEDPKEQTR